MMFVLRHFLVLSLIVSSKALALCPFQPTQVPVTLDSLSWYTQDRDFQGIEPADWVYEGQQKAFVGDFANPATFPYIDELAGLGVTVIHTGGPEPYFPLKRDGGRGVMPKRAH